MSAEGNLAGHRQFWPNWYTGKSGDEGRDHSDARGWSILRNRAGGDVNVHIRFLIEVRFQTEFSGVRPDPGQSRFC